VEDKLATMVAVQDLQMVPMTDPPVKLWNSWWMMKLEWNLRDCTLSPFPFFLSFFSVYFFYISVLTKNEKEIN